MRNTTPGARLLRHKPLFIGAFPRNANTDKGKLNHLERLLVTEVIDTPMFIMFAHAVKLKQEDIEKVLVKNSIEVVALDEVIF